MFLLAMIAACVPYEGLDPATALVVNRRYVDCEAQIVVERQRNNPNNFDRVATGVERYDQWGNLAFQRRDFTGGTFFETQRTYRGKWLQHELTFDNTVEPATSTDLTWTWDGIFLEEVFALVGNRNIRITYDNDGVVPYTTATRDVDLDGVIDVVTRYRWSGDRVEHEEVDELDDGVVDSQTAFLHDDEGRPTSSRFDHRDGSFDYIEQQWAGPHDNLLSFRQESGVLGGARSVFDAQFIWNAGWTEAEAELRLNGNLTERRFETFDGEGRYLTRRYELMGDSSVVRDTYTWSCP